MAAVFHADILSKKLMFLRLLKLDFLISEIKDINILYRINAQRYQTKHLLINSQFKGIYCRQHKLILWIGSMNRTVWHQEQCLLIYSYIYIYIYNIHNIHNMHNIHNIYMPKCMDCQKAIVVITGRHIVFMIAYKLCSSCFCEIWVLCVSWITYESKSNIYIYILDLDSWFLRLYLYFRIYIFVLKHEL